MITVEEMRDLLGLGPEVSDAEVADLYAASLANASWGGGEVDEPLSLAEAKAQLRLGDDEDIEDALILNYIEAAREWAEDYTGHVLVARQVVERFPAFTRVKLRAWPIDSIASVNYLDTAGALTLLDAGSYRLLATSRPATLGSAVAGVPTLRSDWPALLGTPDGILVTINAGYASAADVPKKFKQAMKMLVTGFYESRDTGGLDGAVEAAARALLRPARLMTL